VKRNGSGCKICQKAWAYFITDALSLHHKNVANTGLPLDIAELDKLNYDEYEILCGLFYSLAYSFQWIKRI